ncbi:unnamed protein product [Brassica oleracea]
MNLSQKQPFETQPVKTRSVTLRRPAPKSTLPLHSSRQSSRYVGFMDIETYTNPIEQSIAHLLFHRPSDISLWPDEDVLTYKSHLMIPQPNSSRARG